MKKFPCLLLLVLQTAIVYGQPETKPIDSLAATSKKWTGSLSLLSRYLWRGQAYGGKLPALQVSLEYTVTDRLAISTWATTNFQKCDAYPDGSSRGYQEFDLGLTYQLKDFMTLSLWDYYWPSIRGPEDENTGYFYYGPNSVKSLDVSIVFDFSEGYRYGFNATLSTLLAGNDYRYDSGGKNPKRNFTTYAEAGYTFKKVFDFLHAKKLKAVSLAPAVGVVLNNQAQYYAAARYNKASVVNLSVAAMREFDWGRRFVLPVSLNYVHNPARENTELEGRNFFYAVIAFQY